MNTYKIRTNYINLLVLLVFWGFPVICQGLVPQFSIYRYSINTGHSEKFSLYLEFGFIPILYFVVMLIEYYRGLKHIDVQIDDKGINANWFNGYSANSLLGQRIEKNIKWEEIEKFDYVRTYGSGLIEGMWVKTKDDKRKYWITYLGLFKTPKQYLAMIDDFETHYNKIKGIVKKPIENFRFTDFPDI